MELFNVDYHPVLHKWITAAPEMPLGPGSPVESASRLKHIPLEELFEVEQVRDSAMARCCLAGLLLRYNFLDESHTLSQSVLNATGSYWHGMMHRREPDYGNAKYWFLKVGSHPIFMSLARAAGKLATRSGVERDLSFLRESNPWDPAAFIDVCASAIDTGGEAERLAIQVQAIEWKLLMAYSFAAATAGPGT